MRKHIESDEELATHFTAAIGVRAQSYEPVSSRSFDPGEAHVAMRERAHRRRLERYAAVQGSVGATPAETRHVLELIYAPFGTGYTSRRRPGDLSRSSDESPDFLSLALTPAWGHGSYVRLALTQKRVLTAFARQHPGKPSDPGSVQDFLAFEAGKGNESATFFRAVREACDLVRTAALDVYDRVRLARVETERASSKLRAAERRRMLDEELGRKASRERQRFEARLRGVS